VKAYRGVLASRIFAGIGRAMLSSVSPRRVVTGHLREKAHYCRERQSQLYSVLLETAGRDVLDGGPCWRVLKGHERDRRDSALALRFLGGVHRLVLQGRAPQLSEFFPTVGGRAPPADAAGPFLQVVEDHEDAIRRMTRDPVQTNEVGRCGALVGGFLLFARETGLPLRLLEIGASAGLNLRWDLYRYTAAGASWGPCDSPVVVDWDLRSAPPPLDVRPSIVERRGCDLAPVDPCRPEGCQRLMSYVWADHVARFRLLEQALELAARYPLPLDRANASDWLEEQLREPHRGVATIVFHSIVMQFMSPPERRRVCRLLAAAGRRATRDAPLAWLRMEGIQPLKDVLLTRWPVGDERPIARAGLYGRPVFWHQSGGEGVANRALAPAS
jgi:hypothetical protein